MKNKWVLRGILLSALILSGCNVSNNNNSKPSKSSVSISTSSADEKGELLGINVSTKNTKTKYLVGEEFVKPVVYAHWSKWTDTDVSDLCEFQGFDSSKPGEMYVTVIFNYSVEQFATTEYYVSVKADGLSFDKILEDLSKYAATETKASNSANRRYDLISGKTTDTEHENIKNYSDHSSTSEGVYVRLENDKATTTDSYKTIKTVKEDKYRLEDDSIATFKMFVTIKDYKEDLSTSSNYKDKVSKRFVVNSAKEAESAGLQNGQYVLSSDVDREGQSNLVENLFNFIAGYCYSNIYIETLGLNTITETKGEDEYEYTFKAEYSYEGETNSIVSESLVFSYKTDLEKDRLTWFNYSYIVTETSKSDKSDTYRSGFEETAKIFYGNKYTSKDDECLKVEDYFVRSITEIKILARNSRFDDVEVDPSLLTMNYSYIFAEASKFFPKTAVDTSLSPYSSTNEKVVAIENGMFKIMGEGTTELAFSYYQLIDGIYELAFKYATISVSSLKVESISFGIYETNFYQQYGLLVGKTYDWPINVSPYKADASVSVEVSDPTILKVDTVKDRELKFTPLKGGKVTVKITSLNNPNATATKEFYVLDPSIDMKSYLTSKTFKHPSPYGYTFETKFNANGTGTRHLLVTSTGETRDDTFNYTLEGNVITFSNFSSHDDNSYVKGTIVKFLDRTGEPMGIYCETNEKGQPFYEM